MTAAPAVTRILGSARDTEAVGERLGAALEPGLLVYLHGALGAGKTTLVRGMLRGRGYQGAVKSPTYTLVEPYEFDNVTVFHFDLYRMNDPEELEFLGIRDYLQGHGVCLIEWAERGAGVLPAPDAEILLSEIPAGRSMSVAAHTPKGAQWARAAA